MKAKLLLFIFALVLSLVPAGAEAQTVQYRYYDNGTWTTGQVTEYTEINADNAPTTLSGTTDNPGWYVVTGEVSIGDRIAVSGTVNLILADGCTLTASRGINVGTSNTLNIYAQSEGDNMGTLIAGTENSSITYGAGIGGGNDNYESVTGGKITIHGGNITATGGSDGGAGIGGGFSYGGGASGGNIIIYSGNITAKGSSGYSGGAGIGGGSNSTSADGGRITIHGGTINATGGSSGGGAGIGGGRSNNLSADGGEITISGGEITATSDSGGAGIGGGGSMGSSANGETITISGGVVKATGYSGAGIGGGCNLTGSGSANGGSITISGGVVEATGDSGAGIGSGYSDNTSTTSDPGTFSTTDSGNAIIFASGGISASDSTTDWSGVIFQGNAGTIYGTSVTPTEDFEVPEGYSLTIGEGKTLTVKAGVTLTNKGTITVEGALTNNGTIRNLGAIYGNITGSGKVVGTVEYLDENRIKKTVEATSLDAVLNETSATTLTGGTSEQNPVWFVVGQNLTTAGRITINGYVNLILKDGFVLNAQQGINVSEGNTFSVYAQSTGENTAGKLFAGQSSSYTDYTENYGAGIGGGIGGGTNANAGIINLYGGVITATGGLRGGAGIGGGYSDSGSSSTGGSADGGSITITGMFRSVVKGGGTTGSGGAGIGGGYSYYGTANGGTINITNMRGGFDGLEVEGGTVSAGGVGGAGIGGGYSANSRADGGEITIQNVTDGPLTVSGASLGRAGGAGIGGGYGSTSADGGKITIQNVTGKLTANGAKSSTGGFAYGAGIGGGCASGTSGTADGGDIAIAGGTVTATGASSSTGGEAYGAGIGGGYGGGSANGGKITVKSGSVTATGAGVPSGAAFGAGIGGGYANGTSGSASGGEIAIEGGSVKATGASSSTSGGAAFGAGIGGGSGSSQNASADGGSVTITGGYVEAKGARVAGSYAGAYGADIGGGGYYSTSGGSYGAVSGGTFSTTGGNAVIFASSIGDQSNKNSWSGVIFEGVSGAVYGTNIETGVDFEVPAGSDLSIGEGQTLTLGAGTTLTNSGWIFLKSGGQLKYGGSLGTFKGNEPVALENPGTGSEEDPYQIPDLATLEFYRERINQTVDCKEGYAADHYQLTANIDMSEKYSAANPWTPIGTNDIMDNDNTTYRNYFSGVFDGNGHTITGLHVSVSSKDDAAYAGLFGIVKGGTVKDLTISGGSVSAATTGNSRYSAYAGAVAGSVSESGTISNCAVKDVSVSATTQNNWAYAGGVAGYVIGSGSVSNCAVSGGAISASTAGSSSTTAGGVAGYVSSGGSVTNCAASCDSVTATKYAGGVVGMRNPNDPSTVSSCYYDNEKYTGNGIGYGGGSGDVTGKTTAQFASGEVAWLLQGEQSTQVWGQTIGESGDATPVLTDIASAKVYKVAFMNGSEEFAAGYANSGDTVALPETNPTPTDTEKYFSGWFDSETGGTKYTEGVTISSEAPTNMTAYAQWEPAQSVDLHSTAVSAFRAWSEDGAIRISHTASVQVFDATGRLVYAGQAQRIVVPQGMYIVRSGKNVQKVVVK